LANFNSKITDSLHPCLEKILNALKGIDSGKIADIIKKFSGEVPGWDLHFDENFTLTIGDNAQTDPDLLNGKVMVHLNFDNLSKATDLSVARTMIHECIHAYLTAFFSNDPILANATYPDQFEAWFTKEANGQSVGSTQHDLMVAQFLGDIATALEQYGKAAGYNLSPQFYKDMAWGGLQRQLMNSSVLTFIDQTRIRNTIEAENTNAPSGSFNPIGKKSCN